jgi:hypothetical protein
MKKKLKKRPYVRKLDVPGRNADCPCGCGKKAKDHWHVVYQDELAKKVIEKRKSK